MAVIQKDTAAQATAVASTLTSIDAMMAGLSAWEAEVAALSASHVGEAGQAGQASLTNALTDAHVLTAELQQMAEILGHQGIKAEVQQTDHASTLTGAFTSQYF